MLFQKHQPNHLKASKIDFVEVEVDIKLKLACLWTSFMFLYIYVDYFHLYMPSTLTDILKGKVFVFDISQAFLLIAMIMVTLPVLMIFISVVLPAKVNRILNIIVAILFIPYMLFNLVGEAWMHMVFAAIVEVLLLCFIIYYAWNWPLVKKEETVV
jgi:hypothetical protein